MQIIVLNFDTSNQNKNDILYYYWKIFEKCIIFIYISKLLIFYCVYIITDNNYKVIDNIITIMYKNYLFISMSFKTSWILNFGFVCVEMLFDGSSEHIFILLQGLQLFCIIMSTNIISLPILQMRL